jgi:5'(3')-deoxyribonucleotidase
MTTILLDCDGVLADFATPALAIVERLGGPKLLHDQLEAYDIGTLLPNAEARAEFWRAVCAPGFCASLLPYVGALDAVTQLREIGDVVCVTSPMLTGQTWAHERAEWLHDFFGFERSHVISTAGKQWVAGGYFVDDSPDHVIRWRERNRTGEGIALDRPWTRAQARGAGVRVAPSLAHAVDFVRAPKAVRA